MLLTNGRVRTLDATDRVVDTLVIRDGRIAFAGRRDAVNPGVGEPVLDVGGRTVLPGLVDAHAHLLLLARRHLALDLAGLDSEDAAAGQVAAAAARTPAGEWLEGHGWDQNRWPGRRFPTRGLLDRAAPRHPVALVRVDGHATWANAAALRAAGVTRHTPDPAGGRVVKGPDGEPTGLLVDTAQDLVRRIVPPLPEARFDQAVRDAIAACLAVGLTGIHEMGVDLPGLAAYRRLVERGQFPFRNYAAVWQRSADAWAHYLDRGPETIGDGRVIVGAVKLLADGALGSRGAALHAPYSDDPGNRGLLLLPPEELRRPVAAAAARGFQVCVHAIGDRANTLVLDTFERILADAPRPDHRFRVEHAQVLAPADVPRFARLGVLPSMQPTHCTSDMPWAPERLGPERLAGAYAWRSLLRTGVVLAGGSDFPVESPNPFLGLHAAVTRRPPTGEDPGWQPGQRMTREEAVRAFTTWNAFASRRERDLGALEPGRRADLVVLTEDVLTCPEDRIGSIRPVLTMVGGHVAFAAAGAPEPGPGPAGA